MTLTVNDFTLSMSENLTDDSDYTIFNEIKQNTLKFYNYNDCLLYTSPSPRDKRQSRMPSSA